MANEQNNEEESQEANEITTAENNIGSSQQPVTNGNTGVSSGGIAITVATTQDTSVQHSWTLEWETAGTGKLF